MITTCKEEKAFLKVEQYEKQPNKITNKRREINVYLDTFRGDLINF